MQGLDEKEREREKKKGLIYLVYRWCKRRIDICLFYSWGNHIETKSIKHCSLDSLIIVFKDCFCDKVLVWLRVQTFGNKIRLTWRSFHLALYFSFFLLIRLSLRLDYLGVLLNQDVIWLFDGYRLHYHVDDGSPQIVLSQRISK